MSSKKSQKYKSAEKTKKAESHSFQTVWLIVIVAGIAWLAISQLRAAPQGSANRYIASESEPSYNP